MHRVCLDTATLLMVVLAGTLHSLQLPCISHSTYLNFGWSFYSVPQGSPTFSKALTFSHPSDQGA